MTIKDKDTFKRLQSAGLLGNYFRMWDNVQQVREADYRGWLTVRARRASDRALFIPAVASADLCYFGTCSKHPAYNLERLTAEAEAGCEGCRAIVVLSHNPADVYLQECPAPTAGRVINLEAMRGYAGGSARDAGWYVRYALNDPTNLRHSLEQNGKDAHGLVALGVLKCWLREDFDQLEAIWNRYPDATIEASRFTQRVGVFDSRTIIWEARNF